MDRRDFLKVLGVAGGTAAGLPGRAKAGTASAEPGPEFLGILVDTTLCTGCRVCERSCAEANGLPAPDLGDREVFSKVRAMSPAAFTVVNMFDTDRGKVTVKKQCMHCNQPACAAACLTKAMLKTRDGPVIWRKDKCMGCRFCMLSCPFDAPKFEYDSPLPEIRKCTMCWSRLGQGQRPACVSNCPAGALLFGPRRKLIEVAGARIHGHPGRYTERVYGEHEAGGTGYLYLAATGFENLGFNTTLDRKPYPELTTGFLYSVPLIFLLWPAMLLALHVATRRKKPDNPAHDWSGGSSDE